jgi:hypothetical protein
MSRQRSTHPGVIAALRGEYERRTEREAEEVHRLGEDQDRMEEELRRARRHLLFVERQSVLDAYHRGDLSVRTYEKLLADIDGRLMMSESSEEPPPRGGRTPGAGPEGRPNHGERSPESQER